MKIAIVGLGRVGSKFISKMIGLVEKGVEIIAVAEKEETEGKKIAEKEGFSIKEEHEIAAMGSAIDVIFDLTGQPEVRQKLRDILKQNKNLHTVIAPETVAYLICSILEDGELPDVHEHKGY